MVLSGQLDHRKGRTQRCARAFGHRWRDPLPLPRARAAPSASAGREPSRGRPRSVAPVCTSEPSPALLRRHLRDRERWFARVHPGCSDTRCLWIRGSAPQGAGPRGQCRLQTSVSLCLSISSRTIALIRSSRSSSSSSSMSRSGRGRSSSSAASFRSSSASPPR